MRKWNDAMNGRWVQFGLVTVGLLMVAVPGCGPSQEDLMMRAARRSRPTNASENQAKKAEQKKDQQAPSIAQQTPAKQADNAEDRIGKPNAADTANQVASVSVAKERAEDNESAKQGEPAAKASDEPKMDQAAIGSILPIDQRKPEQTLAGDSARARATENLESIAKALMKYNLEKKVFPRTYSKSSSGIQTLSWRVELLPYLGYEELYNKFDQSVPWNREPNKSLLQYIPDEFVSPERFDTKTNYLLPAHRLFMFGDNKQRTKRNLEDGAENTIMLLEVNDELAVPWTKPADYAPENLNRISADLGELRKDGAFAVWANGWTVLLAKGLSNTQLLNALTYESGDGQLAGAIHRDIPLSEISEAAVAATPKNEKVPDQTDNKRPSPAAPVAVVKNREAVPIAAEIARAQQRLRAIFAERISEAKEEKDKVKLAEDILEDSIAMESDPAGAYALQSAAMSLAIEGGDPETVIKAVDYRVGRFEVDAYDENAKALVAFSQKAPNRESDESSNEPLLSRSVMVIYAGIADNDFSRASAVARLASRYTGQERHEEIPKLFGRLRVLLGTSKQGYEAAIEDLKLYREDPNNVEAGNSFGRFLCFVKGDWQNGLPLLTKGGSRPLREIANMDLNGALNDKDRVELGDVWWELSEKARAGVYRQAARDRAVFWYQQAYDTLPESLDRMHVKSRMDDADQTDGASPIALCLQLADEFGLDLSVGLAGIAEVGQKRSSGGDGGRDEYD